MHYDVAAACTHMLREEIDPLGHDAGGSTAPSGVEEGNRPLARSDEVDRDTVGHGNQQERARDGCGVAVCPFEQGPTGRQLVMPEDPVAMDLMREDRFGGVGKG